MSSSTMTNGPFRIDATQLKKLDISTASVRRLTDDEVAKFRAIQQQMMAKPTNLDELKNHVSQKIYAQVKVNGKIVATLYNSGAAELPNAAAGSVMDLPSMGEGEMSTGPELAQKRADEIAKALGGTVVKASTAVTQAVYLATPPFEVKYDTDKDLAAATSRTTTSNATAQTTTDAQLIGQGTAPKTDGVGQKFLDFMKGAHENPGGFYRAQILASKGLTEDDVAAMSPEERQKLEDEIEAKIKEKFAEATEAAKTAQDQVAL